MILWYLCIVRLEFWKDLWVNHVQLSLDLVTSDVVDHKDVFIKDQVFCCGRKPAQKTLSISVFNWTLQESLWRLVLKWETTNLSIHFWYWSVARTDSGVMWTTSAAASSVPPVWYLQEMKLYLNNFISDEEKSIFEFITDNQSTTFWAADWCKHLPQTPLTDTRR